MRSMGIAAFYVVVIVKQPSFYNTPHKKTGDEVYPLDTPFEIPEVFKYRSNTLLQKKHHIPDRNQSNHISLSFYILPHQQSKSPDLIIAKHFLISKYLSENFNGVLFIEFGIYAAFLADKSRTPHGFASTMNVFP